MKKLTKSLIAAMVLGTLTLTINTNATIYSPQCAGGTIGFWANKNGQWTIGYYDYAYLRRLHLVDANGNKITFLEEDGWWQTGAKNLSTWFKSASATNMKSMLSVQLAAFQLNCIHGRWRMDDELVGESGFTSRQLIAISNDLLLMTEEEGSTRELQEIFKDILDWANNQAHSRPDITDIQGGFMPCFYRQDYGYFPPKGNKK